MQESLEGGSNASNCFNGNNPFLKKGGKQKMMEGIHIPGATPVRSRGATGLWIRSDLRFYDESRK